MSEIVEDAPRFNAVLCIIGLILLIFVGGEFILVVPEWVYILLGIALLGALYRTAKD